MATQIFVINNTQGTVLTSLQPGATNGPGSAQQTSDLKLFGTGAQRWGEGFDENFVRLTENFACPNKIGFPDIPQDFTDLGPGNGINRPLNGQLWFNTTDKRLRVFTNPPGIWESTVAFPVQATAPLNPSLGNLWFDTTQQQLKIFDGISFVSVAERYLLKSGDVMTAGFLTLFQDPSSPLHAATKQYVDDTTVSLSGDTMIAGFLTLFQDPTLALHAATKQYVDNTTVSLSGDTMTGNLIMTSGTDVTLPDVPTVGTDAANKAYVDAAIAAAIAPFSNGLSGTFNNVTSIRAFNTTYTNSFGKDMLVVVTGTQAPTGGTLRGVVDFIPVPLLIVVEQKTTTASTPANIAFVVDVGANYRVNTTGAGPNIVNHWYEYR